MDWQHKSYRPTFSCECVKYCGYVIVPKQKFGTWMLKLQPLQSEQHWQTASGPASVGCRWTTRVTDKKAGQQYFAICECGRLPSERRVQVWTNSRLVFDKKCIWCVCISVKECKLLTFWGNFKSFTPLPFALSICYTAKARKQLSLA